MIAGLQDGTVHATYRQWPSYFYEDGAYDPNDKLKGLFRGHIAWRVRISVVAN